ncbi:MAG: nucleotidyltransferase family protein [Deltaproteobacteria bacterium]|nr:nucleotidyltransferase family protein [Deltaproteobacteria bacterium]
MITRPEGLTEILLRVPRIPAASRILERRLALACLGLLDRAPGAIRRLIVSGASLEWTLELAERFAIAPRLASVLARARILDELPESLASRIRDVGESAHARNLALLTDLLRVGEALDGASIPYVATKGSAILAGHVKAYGDRHLDDIDLLIAPEDVARVEAAILAIGGVIDSSLANVDLHPLTMRGPLGTKVEVHVKLPRTDGREVLARAVSTPLFGGLVRIESPADLTRHVCDHVVSQHIEDPRPLPRHLVDVWRLLRSAGRGAFDESVPDVRVSLGILELVEASQDSALGDAALASWLFPTHHTLVPSGIVSRRSGRGGMPGSLRMPNLRRVRAGLLFRVDA